MCQVSGLYICVFEKVVTIWLHQVTWMQTKNLIYFIRTEVNEGERSEWKNPSLFSILVNQEIFPHGQRQTFK